MSGKEMFLLVDKGITGQGYASEYVLFDSYEDCKKEADLRGFSGGFMNVPGMGRPSVYGTMSRVSYGEVDIGIMMIAAVEEKP